MVEAEGKMLTADYSKSRRMVEAETARAAVQRKVAQLAAESKQVEDQKRGARWPFYPRYSPRGLPSKA